MLKRTILILAITLFTATLFAQNIENDSISTYYLIRHAEKDRSDSTNKNPGLTEKGILRALKWSQLFEQFQIDAVYSTSYNRTQNTALPTANNNNNLTIKTYHPFKIDMLQFLKDTKGKSVLIVGHSNTTPEFANKLIGKEIYQDIDDNNNANLYIVTIKDGEVSHVLIRMK
ncbi:SixA phosphatase family protein [Psychroserpens sp.]